MHDVHHQGNQGGQVANDVHHGDHQRQGQRGIGRSVRPGTALPDTVLITHLCDGGLLLHGWRGGPSAYLSPSDAPALRRELAAAFGSRESARRGDQDELL
ncbi:MAG: hypothetical protein ACRDRX_21590 [Pseudonocardiaceae bacterium]